MKKNKKNLILSAFLAFILFSGGYVLGYARSTPISGIFPQITNKFAQKPVDFGIFWKVWDTTTDKFDGNLDPQKMLYGAISGMIQATGDPYTEYFTPEEAKNFENDLSGTFSGIGAEIGIKNDHLTVIAPLTDSPSDKAGLKAGDYIKKINDEVTSGMPIDTAVSKIRGQEGTEVKLLVERDAQDKEYSIKREKIDVKSVKYTIENGILKITVTRFDKDTLSLIKEAEDDGIKQNVKGVILDLRNNPGGLLDSAIDVSSEFVEKGTIVIEKEEKKGKKQSFRASGNGKMTDAGKYPMIVLINKGSASAAEIVAGAIHDNGRGKLIGEKTFGKGSVQEIEKLSDGSELKVTVAHWYTPKNINISKEGIAPDITVELTDADFNANKDPQMDEALRLLRTE